MVVVGADGFIGSAVSRVALEAGAAVTAVCTKTPWRLRAIADDPMLEIVTVPEGRWWTRRAVGELAACAEEADAIALLAYEPPSGHSVAAAHEREVNVTGAVRWGRTAGLATTPLVFTSSADVYGPWCAEPVDEGARPAPATPYAVAKLQAELRLLALLGVRGLTALRLSTVFGPGESGPRAIPAFINAFLAREQPVLHRGGTDVRDYVHVEDVAGAIVNACLRRSEAATINIGSGVGRSTRDVLESIARVMGASATPGSEPTARPSSRLILNPCLAGRELGFRPRGDFEGALAEEARWLDARRAGVAA